MKPWAVRTCVLCRESPSSSRTSSCSTGCAAGWSAAALSSPTKCVALLMEYGIILPRKIGQLRRGLPEILEDESNELTSLSRRLLVSLYHELVDLDSKIEQMEKQLRVLYAVSEPCQRTAAVEGIGVLTATALIAALSDGRVFQNGRQFAAWLGLVPCNTPAAAKRVCSASASVAIRICERCSFTEHDRSCTGPAARRMFAASGSQTSGDAWEPAKPAWQSRTRTRASCGHASLARATLPRARHCFIV